MLFRGLSFPQSCFQYITSVSCIFGLLLHVQSSLIYVFPLNFKFIFLSIFVVKHYLLIHEIFCISLWYDMSNDYKRLHVDLVKVHASTSYSNIEKSRHLNVRMFRYNFNLVLLNTCDYVIKCWFVFFNSYYNFLWLVTCFRLSVFLITVNNSIYFVLLIVFGNRCLGILIDRYCFSSLVILVFKRILYALHVVVILSINFCRSAAISVKSNVPRLHTLDY